jgi:hypothetical protein
LSGIFRFQRSLWENKDEIFPCFQGEFLYKAMNSKNLLKFLEILLDGKIKRVYVYGK